MNLSKSRSAIVASCLTATLALLASTHSDAAGYITTSGSTCQLAGNTGGPGEQIREDFYVQPAIAFNRSFTNRITVACPVIPSPVSGSTVQFYVDGTVFGTGQMFCVLGTYNFFNTSSLSLKNFMPTGQFDTLITFTAAEAPTSAYIGLECEMPPRSGVIGISAVIPDTPATAVSASRSDPEARAADVRAFETHVNAIAASFDREVRDQRWATEAGALLKSVFDAPSMQAVKLTSIDCRTTTCRVELDTDGSPDVSHLLSHASLQTAEIFSHSVVQQLGRSDQRSSVALYMSREK
jgi:hypothetical protein